MPERRRKRVALYSTPANLRRVDPRSAEGRFMAAIVAGLVDQMGGETRVSFAERRVIGHIAKLELLVELGNAKLVAAQTNEGLGIHKDLAFLIGSCIRAMAVLGLDRVQRPKTPTLEEYLASKRTKVVEVDAA